MNNTPAINGFSAAEITNRLLEGFYYGDRAATLYTREVAAFGSRDELLNVMDHAAEEARRLRSEQDAAVLKNRVWLGRKLSQEADGWQEVFTNAYEAYGNVTSSDEPTPVDPAQAKAAFTEATKGPDPFQAERDWEDARADGEPVSIFGFMY